MSINSRAINSRLLSVSCAAAGVVGVLVAGASPASAAPPNCTAADLAGVAAGVSAATAAYLFTHPELNDFVTGLKGQPRDQVVDRLQEFLDARPQVRDEIRGIRQPLADVRARCGVDADAPMS